MSCNVCLSLGNCSSMEHNQSRSAEMKRFLSLPAGAVEIASDGSLLAVISQDSACIYATDSETLVCH